MPPVFRVALPVAVSVPLILVAASAWGAQVESFSPQGFTKDVRQVAVRFSEGMVALGDPDRPAPFVVECPVPGTGRWIDDRHWVYDFEYDVPGAVRCRFELREGTRTLAGGRLEPQGYGFHTGGPSILDHRPTAWRKWESTGVDERQVFLLALDGVADPRSIRQHARCRLVGQPEDIPVEVIGGEARAAILDALNEASPWMVRRLVQSTRAHLPRDPAGASASDGLVLVKCRDELPGGGELRLVWGAGVSGANGGVNRDDQILEFVVRPRFRIELECSASFEDKCLGSVAARFTTPVDRALAGRVRIVDELGRPLEAEIDEEPQVGIVRFPATLAENSRYRAELTGPIKDIDGRSLANAREFPVVIETGQMPPGATFGHGMRIIAAREGATVPVLLRRPPERLDGRRLRLTRERDIARWLLRVYRATRDWSWDDGWPNPQAATRSILANQPGVREFTLTPHRSTEPFQAAGVAIEQPGLHVLELPLPASTAPHEHRFVLGMAMATNLAIDFQHGFESSLVWVTALDDAMPVPNAEVRLGHGCASTPLWVGRTDAKGLARIEGPLPWGPRECREPRLISARKDGDLSVMGVHHPWWFGSQIGPTRFLTIFDRSLYQPGQTVSMKHVLRIPTSTGFEFPPGLPTTADLTIEHEGSGERYRSTADIGADGVAVSEFVLPQEARLGRYRVALEAGDTLRHRSGFRVERFRVGTMRAAVSGPELPMVNPESVPLLLRAWHLAGGPAAYMPVVLRIMVYGDDPYYERYWREWRWADSDWAVPEVRTEHLTLDSDGEARFEVRNLPSVTYGGMVRAEMEYRDANGQVRTASNRFSLRPASVALAFPWGERSEGRFRILAHHLDRSPAAEVAVEAGLYSYSRHEVEQRLPGGFRARKHDSNVRLVAACAGLTDSAGALTCEIPDTLRGERFLVRATALDDQGNMTRMAGSVYSSPRTRSFVELDDEAAFSAGHTVPIDVDLPFAHATALVSVQREGVLDAFVTNLEGSEPRTTLTIEPNYAPNVSVSVLAREQFKASVPAEIPQIVQTGADGRLVLKPASPTWRRGDASVPVDWTANALDVRVTTDDATYSPRQPVRVRVSVLGPDGTPARHAEVTLAAVDEGLLDLRPNRSWDILDAMMHRRYPLVRSSGSLDLIDSPLILWGDRDRKGDPVNAAAPPSFSGSRVEDADLEGPISRRRFNSLLLWKARLATDAEGMAEIEFPLNDLVTSIRIVAVATSGTSLFGTGQVSVRTSQDLILNAGLPDVVRHGDRFRGVFTVRNASDEEQRIEVAARIDGYLELPDKTVTLSPGESGEVVWPVTVPANRERLDWQVTARSETAADQLLARQAVRPSVPVRVHQATLAHLAEPAELPVEPPAGALPGRGGVSVSLRSSLAGGLEAMREYMANYPYTCVEQDLSVAVALGDPSRWSAAMASVSKAMDGSGLLRYFPVEGLPGSPVLTAYALTIADASGNVIPREDRYRMTEGLREYLRGTNERYGTVSGVVDELRAMTAIAALARHGRAWARMLDAVDPSLELLPTSALLDWIDILDRMSPESADLPRAKAILRARLNLQGTTLGFSTEDRDRLWWLMVSGDDNAARAIVTLLGDPDWQADLPRMMRGLFGRQQRGRWRTTVANAWASVAVSRFGDAFEPKSVAGATVVRLGELEKRVAWPVQGEEGTNDPVAERPAPIEVPWAKGILSLGHEGAGAPWSLVTLRAAVPLRQPVSRGYRITRRVEPISRASDDGWRTGDVARVVVEVVADADMTWVVVDDPLPPGAVVLGGGLGGESSLRRHRDYVPRERWPVYVERDVDSYRAYYRQVPKGMFRLAYRLRYNTAGEFHLPASRVEAMYAPEMYAEWPVGPVSID